MFLVVLSFPTTHKLQNNTNIPLKELFTENTFNTYNIKDTGCNVVLKVTALYLNIIQECLNTGDDGNEGHAYFPPSAKAVHNRKCALKTYAGKSSVLTPPRDLY